MLSYRRYPVARYQSKLRSSLQLKKLET
ncbi:hypothetical protein CUMW_138720 [Citrus unshiu]|uniref:Uncharacterized protein n=1 Tax=Citrus unshiu TaxID=55188 RepID=A0A2H5PI41_CITUN|nr:hypothetical protein CUMW_138720 [Citrus unshiu]